MDNSNKNQTNHLNPGNNFTRTGINENTGTNGNNGSEIEKAATELLNGGKKLASAIYEDGLHRVCEAEDQVKEYSDKLMKNVQENPMASVLIAGGIGFLLSVLLRK